MPTKAVLVSIDVELLRRVDAQPETRKRGRSAFVRSAIEFYLRAKKRREIDEAISTAFADDADAMLDERLISLTRVADGPVTTGSLASTGTWGPARVWTRIAPREPPSR